MAGGQRLGAGEADGVIADLRLLELDDASLEALVVRLRRTCNALECTTTEAGRKTLEDYRARLLAAEAELERRCV